MKCTLRNISNEDQSQLVTLANNNNIASLLTNMFPHPYSAEDGEKFIQMCLSHDPIRIKAIEHEGQFVGCVGIHPQSDIFVKNAELGYWLGEPFWGKGIMTDAVKLIVEYGFDTFDIDRIFARPFGINKGSIRVLEKSGFTKEAHLHETIFKNGKKYDEIYFGIRRMPKV